jgi:hypothetical protein
MMAATYLPKSASSVHFFPAALIRISTQLSKSPRERLSIGVVFQPQVEAMRIIWKTGFRDLQEPKSLFVDGAELGIFIHDSRSL